MAGRVGVGGAHDQSDLRLDIGHHFGRCGDDRQVARALVVQATVLCEALSAEDLEAALDKVAHGPRVLVKVTGSETLTMRKANEKSRNITRKEDNKTW